MPFTTVDAMTAERRPNVTYNAPIGSIDLGTFNESDEPYEIWPSQNCLPFHAEVVLDDDVFVREWHAIECPQFIDLTSNVRHELPG
jgi:hypothetical protein